MIEGCTEVASLDRIAEVADELGYRGAAGYVDESLSEIGARDFVWRDLKDKCGVSAAYFKGAVPLVAFIDAESQQEVGKAHRRLWNFGRVPVLIAATPQEVMALSCVVPPGLGPSAGSAILSSARAEQSVQKVLREFSRFSVESGRAAAAHQARFDRHLRVDHQLLENLRWLRGRLVRSNLGPARVEQLLGRSIFIRYLEDRGILSNEHLGELGPFQSFVSTLGEGPDAVASFFEALSQHFNGDVFAPGSKEKDLPAQALDDLAQFFSGTDLKTGQQALWPYDFAIIPPDLISSIYEQLLADTQQQDAAYYTPRHVVDLVLDELVPWQGISAQPTVLDPSCGSGIFLAEIFRRLAYRHTVADGKPPSFEGLSGLLVTSIYGIDKSAAAIGVSAFSLYLALLEHVDPPTAWREAHLPVLVNRNLVVSDAFDDHALSGRHFDLVVGNPPWKSVLTPAAAAFVKAKKLKLPDRQIALAFLWRAVEFASEGGSVGLVLPAKSFLHNRSLAAETARRRIFSELDVETVVDLSPLRRETFGAAVSPASIAVVRNRTGDREPTGTVHASPRRTPLANAIDGIVVSQENIRKVSPSLTTTSTDVWKAYLWGGPADFSLVTHLRETFPSLSGFARQKGWISGQGFQVRGGDHNDASAISGLPLLPTSSVGPMCLTSMLSEVVTETTMHRPRDPRVYRGPHVIMRKGFRDYPASVFLDFDAAFTDGLFALAGPTQDADEMRVISGLLNSSVAHYWYFMTSSSWGVEREQIQLSEYLSLPIPVFNNDVRTDILNLVRLAAQRPSDEAHIARLLDAAAFRAYGLTSTEKDLVRDGLGTRLDEYRRGPASSAYRSPTARDLTTYCRILASQLNSASTIHWAVEPADRSGGFTVVVCGTNDTPAPDLAGPFSLEQLLRAADTAPDGWRSPAAVMQPSLIVVQGTRVYLIKPDEDRCWTKSSARADAAEVLSAILIAPSTGQR